MAHSDDSVVKEFVRNFLHSLFLKGVTQLNLGKNPWLGGLRGVSKYLEDNTKGLAENDPACVVYRDLFHLRGTGLYGALNAELSVTADVKLEFVQGQGAVYSDFSTQQDAVARQSHIPGMIELADKLADVFATAYSSSSGGQ